MNRLDEVQLDMATIGKIYQMLRNELRAQQEKEAPEMNMPFFESRFPTASSFMLYIQDKLK